MNILIIGLICGLYVLITLISNALDLIIESIGSDDFIPLILSFVSILWTLSYFSN
jgi:hypothetical protein